MQRLTAGERDIAFVFQLFALYPHLTAFENIAFPLRATGENRGEIERKVREVVASLKIERLLGKCPSPVSPAATCSGSRSGGRWSAGRRRC